MRVEKCLSSHVPVLRYAQVSTIPVSHCQVTRIAASWRRCFTVTETWYRSPTWWSRVTWWRTWRLLWTYCCSRRALTSDLHNEKPAPGSHQYTPLPLIRAGDKLDCLEGHTLSYSDWLFCCQVMLWCWKKSCSSWSSVCWIKFRNLWLVFLFWYFLTDIITYPEGRMTEREQLYLHLYIRRQLLLSLSRSATDTYFIHKHSRHT